jgi:hypothetical protein
MIPVFKFSATQLWMTFAMVVLIFGPLHLLSLAHPQSRLAGAWIALGF